MKLFHGMNWERYIEHRKSPIRSKIEHVFRIIKRQFGYKKVVYRGLKKNENRLQTVDKKLFSPEGGRIALSANERIAEFLSFAIRAKFAYVNKLKRAEARFLYIGNGEAWTQVQADSACGMEQSLILGGGSEIY